MSKIIFYAIIMLFTPSFTNFCDYLKQYPQNINIIQTPERFDTNGFYGDSCEHILKSSLLPFNILYVEHIGKNGYFVLNGQKFELTAHLNKNITLTPSRAGRNMNLLNGKGYVFQLQNKKYVCFVAGGLAEYQIGTNQRITFFAIFDITDTNNIKYFMLRGIYGCIQNIGDFNNDGILDFLHVQYNNEELRKEEKVCNKFQMTLLTLDNDNFIPILSNGTPLKGFYETDCQENGKSELREITPLILK